jgi:ketosteroid isomerase-like protein
MAGSDDKAIREMIEARNEAIRARDAKRALEHLAPKAVVYDLRPPLEFRDADARNERDLEEWFATWDGPVTVELRDPTVAVDGDLAFVYGLGHMRGRKRSEGAVDLWYRVTLCFQRRRGQWKVVHEHVSVPFRMDGSDKAALDLKP